MGTIYCFLLCSYPLPALTLHDLYVDKASYLFLHSSTVSDNASQTEGIELKIKNTCTQRIKISNEENILNQRNMSQSYKNLRSKEGEESRLIKCN